MEQIIGGAGGGPDAKAPDAMLNVIRESSSASFVQDVIEASMQRPVLVDFWAPWCGPCKQLTPIIEKLVNAAGGAVALVKINVDDNPQIAQQLRVQSIPAVFVFKDGQPVDGFVGNQPESQIRALIERVAGPVGPSPTERLMEQAAQDLQNAKPADAAQAYGQVLKLDQGNARAIAGLAHCYILIGELDHARQVLGMTPPVADADAAIVAARAALSLAEKSENIGDLAPLQAAVDAHPADHQARYDLALALAVSGDKEGAITHLLESIRKDRKWNDEAARKQLLSLFEVFGQTDPVTADGRRKLSAILFS